MTVDSTIWVEVGILEDMAGKIRKEGGRKDVVGEKRVQER